MNLEVLSTRELQAVGATLLALFSSRHSVADRSVEELVAHLLNLTVSESLPDWEAAGAALSLAGRGDRLPTSLLAKVDEATAEKLKELVELVVEIGIVDMYGACSTRPLEFLKKAFVVARIAVPDVPELPFPSRNGIDYSRRWGVPVSEKEFKELQDRTESILGTHIG